MSMAHGDQGGKTSVASSADDAADGSKASRSDSRGERLFDSAQVLIPRCLSAAVRDRKSSGDGGGGGTSPPASRRRAQLIGGIHFKKVG